MQFDRKHFETAFVEINKRIFNSKQNLKVNQKTLESPIFFLSHYFQKLIIDKPTRVTDTSATLLDIIYKHIPDLCNRNDADILLTKITDHYLIITIRSETELSEKIQFKETQNFSEKTFQISENLKINMIGMIYTILKI